MAQSLDAVRDQGSADRALRPLTRVDYVIARLWRALLQPWLLFAVIVAALAVIAAGVLLPQVPGEFRNEPVATSRWLVTTSSSYGQAGEMLRAAGFYDVLHSPLLWLLLGLAALLVVLQGISAIGSGVASRTLPNILGSDVETGEPIPVQTRSPLFRRRFASAFGPQACASAIALQAVPQYSAWWVLSVPSAGSPLISGNGATAQPAAARLLQPLAIEERMLGLAAPAAYWLRPLAWLGLLACLTVIWLSINFGWQVVTPTLVPGDLYRVAPRDLEVAYLAPLSGSVVPALAIRYHSRTYTETVAADTAFSVGDIRANVTAAAPSLLVATGGDSALLTRPGAIEPESSIGLVFPSQGSEESVLLPSLSTGLRVVRMSAPEQGYLVEIYRSADIRPLRRLYVTDAISETVLLDGARITLEFTPLSGLVVNLRRLPSPWLLWLAVALLGAGLVGYWRRPAFLVVQVAPWPENRSLVILQTDRRTLLDSILSGVVDSPAEPQSEFTQALSPPGLPRGV